MAEEIRVVGKPKMAPVHPGVLLREDVLPGLGVTVVEAARRLRVSRQTLHRIMAGTTSITPEMALRLGKFRGNGPGLWPRMQQGHDLWQAQRRLGTVLARIPTRT